MDKKLFLAFILSTIVLSIYWYLVPQNNAPIPVQIENAQSAPAASAPVAPAAIIPSSTAPEITAEAEPNKQITVETTNYTIVFNTKGASIAGLYLKKYPYGDPPKRVIYKRIWDYVTGYTPPIVEEHPERRVNMIGEAGPQNNRVFEFNAIAEPELSYQAGEWNEQAKSITFSAKSNSGYVINKTFTFDSENYQFAIGVNIQSGAEPLTISPILNMGSGNELITAYYRPQHKKAMTLVDSDYEKYNVSETFNVSNFKWLALTDIYFTTGVKTMNSDWVAEFSPLPVIVNGSTENDPLLTLTSPVVALAANSSWSAKFDLFAGPKDIDLLEKFDSSFTEVLDLFLNVIARPMLKTLRWLFDFTQNWGLALIFLTIIVRLVLFPLAFIGMRSMKSMSRLTPRIKTLRKKFGEDKQKLNSELMQLYRKNKVNPVGGCLPLLAQLPIFIALYWTLLPAVELREQPFIGWLTDLSHADAYLILPLLMGVTMFVQQRVAPPVASLDPMQQKIMQFFPLVMILFFINFPSGLVLYWVTSNIISILQQLIFNRIKVKDLIE